MSVILSPVVVGTAITVLANVPAGPCTVSVQNNGTSPVYWGSGSNLIASGSSANALVIPASSTPAITYEGDVTSSVTTLYALTTSGSATCWVTLQTPR